MKIQYSQKLIIAIPIQSLAPNDLKELFYIKSNLFVCKGKRLANYLIENEIKIVRVDCDQKSKGFLVFLFERNEKLKEVLDRWETDKETYMF